MPERRRWTGVLAGAVLAAVFAVPFLVPIPGPLARMRPVMQVGQLAHVALPLVLALLLHRFGPLRGRPWPAAAAALLLAAICELPQGLVGRSARLRDVGFDLAGVAAAGAWLRFRASSRRRWLLLCLAALAIVPWHLRSLPGRIAAEVRAAERFPLLGDFETGREMWLWSQNVNRDGALARVEVPGGGGVLEISGDAGDYYPGAVIRGAPRDWSGHRLLVWDARVAAGDSATICVRLDDFESRADSRWCGGCRRIGPGWTRCELDLPRAASTVAGREFRLDDIDSLVLYLTRLEGPTTVWIDNLELKRGAD